MKKIIYAVVFFTGCLIEAQISSLADMASGELKMFAPIYEKDNDVYGYFSLFTLDKLNENEEKHEYIILDKNLNKVANGEFIDATYKGLYSAYYLPDKVGEHLVLTKRYGNVSGSVAFTSTRILELKNNILGEPFYFENNTLHQDARDVKTLKKLQRKRKFMEIPIGVNDGYVVVSAKKKNIKENPNSIDYYDLNNVKLWSFTFSGDERKTKHEIIGSQDNALYFIHEINDNRASSKRLLQIEIKTGKENFSYLLEDKNSAYSYDFKIKKIGDKTILTGKISPYRASGYNSDTAVGLFKIVLDKEGNELFKKFFLWQDANKFLEMSKSGRLEAGYKLFVHSYFVFDDERIVILSEKFKPAVNLLLGAHIKTEDFVLMQFDSDFNLTKAETIEKHMSKFSSSDFLYSQYLNNKNDAVFFYRDYQKDAETKKKNWILGIVSIVDGEINHEKIPMSSDEFFIQPYIAKAGYILLREFNKNSDFDKIRLERLNLN